MKAAWFLRSDDARGIAERKGRDGGGRRGLGDSGESAGPGPDTCTSAKMSSESAVNTLTPLLGAGGGTHGKSCAWECRSRGRTSSDEGEAISSRRATESLRFPASGLGDRSTWLAFTGPGVNSSGEVRNNKDLWNGSGGVTPSESDADESPCLSSGRRGVPLSSFGEVRLPPRGTPPGSGDGEDATPVGSAGRSWAEAEGQEIERSPVCAVYKCDNVEGFGVS